MKPLYLLLSFILSTLSAWGSFPDVSFRHYSTENGLPSNCVRAIVQDRRGFIWCGTDGGVVRFDGQRFKHFPVKGLDNTIIEDEFVSSLHELDDRLWIGLDRRLIYLDLNTEQVHDLQLKYTNPNGAKISGTVRSITSDKDGNIWVAVFGAGVFKINPSTGETVNYECREIDNMPGYIFVDSRNDVWTVSNYGRNGLCKLDKAADEFRPFSLTHGSTPLAVSALALAEGPSHTMLLGTWYDGLVRFDPYTGQASNVVPLSLEPGLFHIHSISPWKDDLFLVGADEGLTVVNTSNWSTKLLRHNELDRGSLSDQFVYPVTRDRENGVWIGTFYGGVNYIAPSLKPFEMGRHSRFVNSVSGNIISAFCEDRHGNVWIASDDGGVCCRSLSSGQYQTVKLPSGGAGTSNDNVHALCFDGDDLWIGTYTRGVWVYNTVTHAMRQYIYRDGDPNSLGGKSSYAIYRDRNGNMWVATMSTICRFNRGQNNFTRLRNIDALTNDIDEDDSGNLWFSTQGKGLFRYNPTSGNWKNYRFAPDSTALPHDHVNCVNIDSRHNLWVATAGGLVRYRPATDDFERISVPSLPADGVLAVVEDQGVLWLTTSNGLVRHVPGGETSRYTTGDGLVNNQFTLNSALKTSRGKIYTGTVRGFNAFFPYEIRPNQYTPPLAFTGLDIINTPIVVGDPRLPESLNSIKTLTLTHEDYIFSIGFAALSYANPGKNRIRYRLDGFDNEWIMAGDDNKATYTNLPPGSYKLRVMGSNNDNLWSDEELTLNLKILPPWYLSPLMKIIYTLLLVTLIGVGIRLLLQRNERRHRKELEHISINKEKEIFQSKLSFFTMIAHEVRTPVSLIIGPLEKIMNSSATFPPAVRDNLNVINRNSQRLLFLINQLLDFKKVEQNALTVHFTSTNISMLITAVAERFEPSISQRGGTLTVVYPHDNFKADVDPEALTKLISNLLNNARKFTRSLVRLTCLVNEPDGTFTISVTDDGIGISRDNQAKIFKPFFQVMDNAHSEGGTGLGLSIVQSVVEAHRGTITVESSPGHGATFIVTLPITQPDASTSSIEPSNSPNEPSPLLPVATPSVNARPVMLIVDDNEEMLRFIGGNFDTNYDVVTAVNGREALEKLAEYDVTIIVSDWMMPVMDGVELCRAVRSNSNYSHIPFLLLTAKTDNFSKIEGLNCGADSYVEKPFSVDYLEARISNLLEMRKLLRQRYSQMPLEPINTLASTPMDDVLLTRLSEIIEENFSNPSLSVDFLAEQLGISRSGLYSKIKTLASVTPNELIQITRLKKAAQLLSENKYRINEICYMVGFNSSSYFSKCFQKQFGMKPGEFTLMTDHDTPSSTHN